MPVHDSHAVSTDHFAPAVLTPHCTLLWFNTGAFTYGTPSPAILGLQGSPTRTSIDSKASSGSFEAVCSRLSRQLQRARAELGAKSDALAAKDAELGRMAARLEQRQRLIELLRAQVEASDCCIFVAL